MPQIAGLATLAVVLSACSSSATPAGETPGGSTSTGGQQSSSATPGAIKRGGTMTRHVTSSFAGADPAMGQNAWQMWHTIGTFMVRREPDTWQLAGDAIEKWEFSPDGMEVTLHVRKGVKWENKPPINGRDVEAKDVVYTLKSITGQQYPDLPALRFPRRSAIEDMADAVAVDPYTVKVTLKNPSASFIDGLTDYRSPLTPDGIREHFGGRDALAQPSVERYFSAGPFTLTKFIDSQESVYTRYPDYWEKAEDGQSKPYLDAVRELTIVDQGTANAAFLAGQLDYLDSVPPEVRDQLKSTRPEVKIVSYEPNSCWYYLAFNTTRKPFDDVRVRTALAMVLDQKESGTALWGDFEGQPVWRYPGPLGFSFPEAIPQEELAKMPRYESPKSQKTIDEAKRLLDEAGVGGGFEFEIISSSSSTMRDMLQMNVSQITRSLPNVKIKATPIDNAINLERSAKGDFDAQNYCYIHEPTAVAMLKTAFHSKGGRNVARLNDPKMDDLLDRASVELDKAKRDALIREAQLRTMEVNTIIPTMHKVSQMAQQSYLMGMRLGAGTIGNGMFAKEVWLNK